MDASVKITKVQDVAGINSATLAPAPHTQVTYTVGDHGPFTVIAPADKATSDYIHAEIQKKVETLKAIGALPQT